MVTRKWHEPDHTTQLQAVARALFRNELVTVATARRRWGCQRLAARIHELRRRGLAVAAVSEPAAKGQPVVSYRLAITPTMMVRPQVAKREAWAG